MKHFLLKIVLFILPFFLYAIIAMFTMPEILSLRHGPSTKRQIETSFKNAVKLDYDLLILGNSRIYRGFNPDMFAWSCYNFSHDNDSFNQMYYKIKFLKENQKNFKYVVIGVDYFQFSFLSGTRNYVYGDFLPENYLSDFEDNNLWKLKFDYYTENINPNKLLLLKPKKHIPFHRENGQYIKHGRAKENDTIQRDISRLAIQETYFKKTLELCKSENIVVFLVMPPTRQNELNSYTMAEMNEFTNYIHHHTDNKNVFYLNYSTIPNFTTQDFTDITHLNESAANRISKILSDDLVEVVANKK